MLTNSVGTILGRIPDIIIYEVCGTYMAVLGNFSIASVYTSGYFPVFPEEDSAEREN